MEVPIEDVFLLPQETPIIPRAIYIDSTVLYLLAAWFRNHLLSKTRQVIVHSLALRGCPSPVLVAAVGTAMASSTMEQAEVECAPSAVYTHQPSSLYMDRKVLILKFPRKGIMGAGRKGQENAPMDRVRTGRVTRSSRSPKTSTALSSLVTVSADSPAAANGTQDGSAVAARPAAAGAPPAWAETRSALCDTLGWFRSTQGGCYHNTGICYGFLLDADSGDRAYMDDEVIITRIGGGCEKDDQGGLVLKTDHRKDDSVVVCSMNTMETGIPVGVIVGDRNGICPSTVPYKYNVMAFFRITHVWFEKVGVKDGARIRLEKVDLDSPSWWAPKGAAVPLPLDQREDVAPAPEPDCPTCGAQSPHVYTRWMCLDPGCEQFWKIDGLSAPRELVYNPEFLRMRSRHLANVRPEHSLAPDIATKFGGGDPLISTARSAWRGIVCPLCRRCISRIYWEGWVCETDGCTFKYMGQVRPIPLQSVLQDAEFGAAGHRMPHFSDGAIKPTISFMKNYRKDTFDLPGVGTVTHFAANMAVNARPGGPNSLFDRLQVTEGLGLRRYGLSQSQVSNTLTCHFAVNYGMPYKYVVDVSSRPFSDAPDVLLASLGRLTWAAQNTVKAEEFQKPNELLTLGYFDKMSIGFHDDGEESLGPTIATLSLGASAKMKIRMKEKYFKGCSARKIPTKGDPMLPGSVMYEERTELARKYHEGEIEKVVYDTELQKIFAKLTRKAPPTIELQLHHGDLVVMHGENLQKYYEHAVKPEGAMRFALTARYIKPDLVHPSEHWKGDFTPSAEFEYDGDE